MTRALVRRDEAAASDQGRCAAISAATSSARSRASMWSPPTMRWKSLLESASRSACPTARGLTGVAVAPDQAGRNRDAMQLVGEVGVLASHPCRGLRKLPAVLRAPILGPAAGDVQPARGCDKDETADLLRLRERQPDRDNAAHGLRNHVAAVRDRRRSVCDQIVVAVDRTIMGLSPGARPIQQLHRPTRGEPFGNRSPELRGSGRPRKEREDWLHPLIVTQPAVCGRPEALKNSRATNPRQRRRCSRAGDEGEVSTLLVWRRPVTFGFGFVTEPFIGPCSGAIHDDRASDACDRGTWRCGRS
jgi:hypothetical protein